MPAAIIQLTAPARLPPHLNTSMSTITAKTGVRASSQFNKVRGIKVPSNVVIQYKVSRFIINEEISSKKCRSGIFVSAQL